MNWRKLRAILKVLLFLQIFMFGLLTILATGGSSNPDDGELKPGSLSFSNNSYTATEGTDAAVTITVIRTGGSDGAASVDYSTSNGSATQPGDYTETSGTLNWADGDDTEKTFDVPITDDSVSENAEAFTVTLANVIGAGFGTTVSATVNITDNDIGVSNGTLQFESANYNVTEGVNPTVTISVTRTLGSTGAVSVDYGAINGTATTPADYAATVGTLNWADGDSSSKSFNVAITDDLLPEAIESFTVNLNNAGGGATIGANSSATVSITDNDQITGTVSAPGGVLAFKEPGILDRMFALIFGKKLQAAIGDLVLPVAGVTVNLYEIDATGAVGAVIDSAVTDGSGQYVLATPPLDSPAVRYIVRAGGAVTMDSRVTSMHVDINPATDATSDLVTTIASDLADLTINEVQEIQADVEDLIPFIVTTDTPNASQISARLQEQALRMGGQFSVLSAKVSSSSICGAIRSPAGVGLPGVDVVVRAYSDWKLVARTITDTIGNYCINVPSQGDVNPDGGNFDGEYIIGAFNRLDSTTDNLRSASGWRSLTTSGSRLDADMIDVSGLPVINDLNMQLAFGATLTGTVQASGGGANLEGVEVVLNDFDTGVPMASATVESDGTYRINVLPGTYLVEAVNTTQAPYASLFYDGASGTNVSNMATPVTLTVGTETTINFSLESGAQLTGTITDGATSDPVIRTRVRIDKAGDANYGSEFTDRLGYYHIWLKPDSYNVYAYGQNSQAVNLVTPGDTVAVDFSDSISRIVGVVQDGSSNPVKHVKLRLYNSAYDFMGFETGDSNGNFTVYTNLVEDHFLEIRIDRAGTSVGSIIYNGQTQLEGGTAITTASAGDDQDLGTITLPAGGMLTGNVYTDALKTTSMANVRVQVRDGGLLLANRFLTVRSRGDGSYLISLPETTYERVKNLDATNTGNCDTVPVVAGSTTVLNFIDGSDTCELNP